MASLYDEYESYVLKYKKEYGDRTVVLYQCGSFYEIYSCGDGNVNIKELCDLLNIQMSRRNKSILEVNRSNTLLAGFPDYTLNKFLNILVDNNYTVVVVSQVSSPPKPKRAVTQILSPGTRIDTNVSHETNNMMSIYFENDCIGLSVIDLSTGMCYVGEVAGKNGDPNYSLDEVYRQISVHNPKEIILFGRPGNKTCEDIVTYLDIKSSYVHDMINLFPKEYTQVAYQNEFLRKVYTGYGLLSPIEYIDMERMPLAIVSFVMILQFSYNHNENLIQKLKMPTKLFQDRNLIISYNAIQQLNLNSLINLLNTCTCSCGKRFFRERILNPLLQETDMITTYDGIDIMLSGKPMKYIQINKFLTNIYDLERLFRKLRLRTLHPTDCLQVITSLQWLLNIEQNLKNSMLYNETIVNDVTNILSEMTKVFDETELGKYHLDDLSGTIFQKGQYDDIDKMQSKLNNLLYFFPAFMEFLNKESNDGYFKMDSNDRDGNYFLITSKRYNEIKQDLLKKQFKWEQTTIDCRDFTVKNVSMSNSNLKIMHPYFTQIGSIINEIKSELSSLIITRYLEKISDIDKKFGNCFDYIVSHLSYIDFLSSCANNAHTFRYVRPTINSSHSNSYVNVENIRHPIVERIQTQVEYVSNNVELNGGGILLYGINSAGKSTLMKSIGLSVIMAQCGMFVPCSSMNLKPYKNIFTRIPAGDDILKGQSTFTVEVLELRNILKRADNNSLVIGDELCSGTESVSALSIVSAGISELSTRNTSFIFATHLHDLTQISLVKNIQNLKVYHLSVIYDENNDKLIYNRKLTEGQGNTLYGLEVCKSLGLGKEFISKANDVRKELLGIESVILSSKRSVYNSQKFIEKCEICKESCDEVHHIQEQILADEYGYIGTINKNDKFNLVCVCTKCHDLIHNNTIKVNGYVQTGDGVELTYIKKENEDNDIKSKVEKIAKTGKKISEIINILSDEYNIQVTRYKVNKILKDLSNIK
jgi:DNA mismatch repair protein MutS